jgi:hypothetical protein
LTREVVKQRQKKSVNKIAQTVNSFMAKADKAFASLVGNYTLAGYTA